MYHTLIMNLYITRLYHFPKKFRVDLFSRIDHVQTFRVDKFSRIGLKSAKSTKINPRENIISAKINLREN